MGAKRRITTRVCFLIVTIISLHLCGCGQAGLLILPVQALDVAQERTFSAGSYRVTGDLQITLVTRIGSDEEEGLLPLVVKLPFEAEYELQGSSGILRITVDMTGMPLPEEFPYYGGDRVGEAYVTADRLYVSDSEGGWHYRAYDFAAEYGTLGITPESVKYWIESADHLEVVEETGTLIKYSVICEVEEDETNTHYVTVDKDTMMILDEEYSFGGYVDSLLEGDAPSDLSLEDAYIIVKRSYRFADFGRAFNVRLPGEAGNAVYAGTSLIGF